VLLLVEGRQRKVRLRQMLIRMMQQPVRGKKRRRHGGRGGGLREASAPRERREPIRLDALPLLLGEHRDPGDAALAETPWTTRAFEGGARAKRFFSVLSYCPFRVVCYCQQVAPVTLNKFRKRCDKVPEC
jgi:hypothetical protein